MAGKILVIVVILLGIVVPAQSKYWELLRFNP